MKKTTFFIAALLIATYGYSQDVLDKSKFKIEYKATDQVENAYDTLVDVSIVILETDIAQISNIYVVGGSQKGLTDKYFKKYDKSDKALFDSKTLQIKEANNEIKISIGRYNLASEMVYFDVFLEDNEGVKTSYLKQVYK